MTKKETYTSDNLQHQSHFLTFFLKTINFFQIPAFYLNDQTSWPTPLLFPWTNSLAPRISTSENVKTVLVDSFLSKHYSNYLHVKLKVPEKDDNTDVLLVRNLTMGDVDLNQFTRLRNQMVTVAETFGREENVSSADTNNVQSHV